MEYMSGEMVRWGFGFANPNHAAAAICALFPFCWGCGGASGVRSLPLRGALQWCGLVVCVVLCGMLVMTYSRTGFVVLAIEAAALWCGRVRARVPAMSIALAVLVISIWWMWPRLVLDGAILNRPKIWLAGLQLFAANPLGVGFGNSGEIATAFMLPDGITVRTLVNSHLTLLVEMGVFVGGAWLAFIAQALCAGRKLRRTWVAFAGLALSAFSASVFDWHVLFDFKEMGGCGMVNFVLAWGLFGAFVVMGVAMIAEGAVDCLAQRRRGAEMFRWSGVGRAVFAVAGAVVGLCAVVFGLRSYATPRVERGYVAVGNGGPCVYRDEGWSLKAVAKRFPDGARFCIRPGVPEDVVDSGEVWLFGDAAEAAWRFPAARLTLVSPPEFCEVPSNAKEIRWQ